MYLDKWLDLITSYKIGLERKGKTIGHGVSNTNIIATYHTIILAEAIQLHIS